jgi:O-acetyl-ADP-ribose deacetylase (regulator of RNase III)
VAGTLASRHVIHAVGPVWKGGDENEPKLLAGAYQRSLELAVQHACRSVAMPALSTGAYGYPIELASRVAVSAIGEFLASTGAPELVRFVLFSRAAFEVFAAALSEAFPSDGDS